MRSMEGLTKRKHLHGARHDGVLGIRLCVWMMESLSRGWWTMERKKRRRRSEQEK